MGLSVFNQVDSSKYFSLSSVTKKALREKGINMPIEMFKDIVRRTPPYTTISTGSDRVMGQRRKTNIYRYEDFVNLNPKTLQKQFLGVVNM